MLSAADGFRCTQKINPFLILGKQFEAYTLSGIAAFGGNRAQRYQAICESACAGRKDDVTTSNAVFNSFWRRRRIPAQLVIQITDRCNARCPQCGMRVTAPFKRSSLGLKAIFRMLDHAARHKVQAVSFTGGEPLLRIDDLVAMIRYAGNIGIPYIRTGTNGFVFRNPDSPAFRDRVRRLADRLADTALRNF